MSAAIKERPILFSAPMVRALLDGSKTQTRRVVKWHGVEPGLNLQFSGLSVERSGSNFVLSSPTRDSHAYRSVPQPCPYGMPGDRLWVRETFAIESTQDYEGDPGIDVPLGPVKVFEDGGYRLIPRYRASEPDTQLMVAPSEKDDIGMRWTPSIHMPRWASRINLEITGVRVERLQDISEADARAEGARECDPISGREVLLAGPSQRGSFVLHYRDIWEQINGAGSWAENPWAWVIEFKIIAKAMGEAP